MAIGRGTVIPFNAVELYDATLSAGQAWVETCHDIPILSSLGQFRLNILTFEKKCFCTPSHKRLRKAQQLM